MNDEYYVPTHNTYKARKMEKNLKYFENHFLRGF